MKRRRSRSRFRLAGVWIALVILAGTTLNVYLALRPAALDARIRAALSSALACGFDFSSFEWSWSRGAEVRDLRLFVGDQAALPSLPGSGFLEVRSVRVRPDVLALLLRGRFSAREVILESPSVHLVRSAEGRWNFEGLLGPGSRGAAETAPEGFPDIVIESGRVRLTDLAALPLPHEGTVEDVHALVTSEPDGSAAFQARLRVDFARRIDLSGSAAFEGGERVVRVHATVKKLEIARAAERIAPPPMIEHLKRLNLKGFVDLAGDFKYSSSEGLLPILVTGSLLRGELDPPGLPLPVRALQAEIVLKERTLELKQLEGSLGEGRIQGEGRMELATPWLSSAQPAEIAGWTLKVSIDSLSADQGWLVPRLREELPPGLVKLLDHYRLEGKLGVDLGIADSRSFPPDPRDVSATIRLDGVDFVYREFPYPLTDLHGEVLLERGRLSFERPIEGRGGSIGVRISGRGFELKRGGEVDVAIKVTSVPIDEKLRSSLVPAIQPIWDRFQLLGSGDAVIEIKRAASQGGALPPDAEAPPCRVSVTAHPRDVRLSYRDFPYEVRGISGVVHLDSVTKRLTFDDLRGQHGDRVITGLGVVELADPVIFKISIRCEALPLDDDLSAALSEGARRLLADFDFKGAVRADVSVQTTEPGASEVIADLELLEGSIEHKEFPYPLRLQGGRVRAIGDHTLEFREIRTPLDAKPAVVASGQLTTRATERTLGFDVDVKDIEFDERLHRALPADLSGFASDMKLGGVYSGKLEGTYTFDEADPSRKTIRYGGSGITARDAAVDFGLRVHDMSARGAFAGGKSPDTPHHFTGEVFVDSAWFNRIHLTKGEVDFVFGEEHPAIQEARKGQRIDGRDYLPPPSMSARLSKEKVKETFQMLVHSDDLYGGVVDGFLYVDSGKLKDMAGHFTGKGLQVARAAEDVFNTKGTGSTGTARGHVSFQGKNGNAQSLVGKGEGYIEDARLFELPLFLGILNVLFGENSAHHHFNEVLMRFDIEDGKFVAKGGDAMEIRSSAVKLVGGGTLDFAGRLDLTFQPRLLGVKIPLVDQILTLIKKGLAQIWIQGDLTNPKVQFVTGAGILRIGIDPSSSSDSKVPLPTDLRGKEKEK